MCSVNFLLLNQSGATYPPQAELATGVMLMSALSSSDRFDTLPSDLFYPEMTIFSQFHSEFSLDNGRITPSLFCGILVYQPHEGFAMNKQTAVRLPEDTFRRLKAISTATGRTATYYIREAIQTHLEDLEDVYFSEMALRKLEKGEDSTLSSRDFWHGLGD